MKLPWLFALHVIAAVFVGWVVYLETGPSTGSFAATVTLLAFWGAGRIGRIEGRIEP